MDRKTISVAEAKKHLSEILGRVAHGGEQITITKRGKPMARLIPVGGETRRLAEAEGWLDESDSFFETIDRIVRDRDRHTPRVLKARTET